MDEPIAGWRGPYHNELSALLSFFALPVYSLRQRPGHAVRAGDGRAGVPAAAPEGPLLRARPAAVQTAAGAEAPAMSRRVVVIGGGHGRPGGGAAAGAARLRRHA